MAGVRLFDKNNKQENPNRVWYRDFEEKIVNADLMQFIQGIISDVDVRKTFVKHAAEIRDHYKNLGENIGSLQNYADGFAIMNKYLDELSQTKCGYTHLIPIASSYVSYQIMGWDYEFKDELGEALTVATKNNPADKQAIKRGIIFITCLAERDLLLLCQRYSKFFFLENREFKFDSKAISFVLGLPGVTKVITRMTERQDQRLNDFENGVVPKAAEASNDPSKLTPAKP